MLPLLPTSLVGSYTQPNWLIRRDLLAKSLPVRVRREELWRIDQAFLNEAIDDEVMLAIFDQERAGLDILTDGEVLDLYAAGADYVQIDEPYLEARPDDGRAYAIAAIDRALRSAPGPTMLQARQCCRPDTAAHLLRLRHPRGGEGQHLPLPG